MTMRLRISHGPSRRALARNNRHIPYAPEHAKRKTAGKAGIAMKARARDTVEVTPR